jgi:hypothetical protein
MSNGGSQPNIDPATERMKIRLQIVTVVCTLLTTVVTTLGGIGLAWLSVTHATATKEGQTEIRESLEKESSKVQGKVAAIDERMETVKTALAAKEQEKLSGSSTKPPE